MAPTMSRRALLLLCLLFASVAATLLGRDAVDDNVTASISIDTNIRNDTGDDPLVVDLPTGALPWHAPMDYSSAADELLSDDPPLDMANIRSQPLSNSLFEVRDKSTEKRDPTDRQYHFRYSHEAIKTSANFTMYAIAAPPDVVREVLDHAIEVAEGADQTEFRTTFNSSTQDLTLIVNAIGSTPKRPTFNWLAYAVVGRMLLNDTATGTDNRTASWVGVVTGPGGKVMAEMAIVPNLVIAPSGDEAGTAGNDRDDGLKIRSVKRELRYWPIADTPFNLVYERRPNVPVHGQWLVNIMIEAIAAVGTEIEVPTYCEYFTRAVPFPLFDGLHGGAHQHTLSFRTTRHLGFGRRRRLTPRLMIAVVRAIHQLALAYREEYGANAYGIQGRIEDARGRTLARWTLGGPPDPRLARQAVCPGVQPRNAVGYFLAACLRP
ncbi:MAG: hypothetical protein M1817_003744 [Caeruleum heppii]|nr:MAG: hypothetical protein M1817_003744 [Caeruleum heppii]